MMSQKKKKRMGLRNCFKRFWLKTSITNETPTQVEEAQSSTQDKAKEKHAETHSTLTKIKFKEKILKAAKEKQQTTYKGIPIRLSVDFSPEIV